MGYAASLRSARSAIRVAERVIHPTIVVKNNETNDKFYRKVAFPRYTESVKFMSQSRETASKLKPHRGLGTRLPSP